jgi:futalosine hydrolase
MNILVTAATQAEMEPFQQYLAANWERQENNTYLKNGHSVYTLTSGVGTMATTFSLANVLSSNKFDLAIQAGIGGSYDRERQLGEVLLVDSEQLGDTGAEDKYNFLDIFDLNLASGDDYPFRNRKLLTPVSLHAEKVGLRKVSGLTINTVSGSSFTATARYKKYECQVESMEGAPFHYVCLLNKIPFLQVRAISNYVETRDKSKWKIEEALKNLNEWLIDFLEGYVNR